MASCYKKKILVEIKNIPLSIYPKPKALMHYINNPNYLSFLPGTFRG